MVYKLSKVNGVIPFIEKDFIDFLPKKNVLIYKYVYWSEWGVNREWMRKNSFIKRMNEKWPFKYPLIDKTIH